jgi:hypothetical protein
MLFYIVTVLIDLTKFVVVDDVVVMEVHVVIGDVRVVYSVLLC